MNSSKLLSSTIANTAERNNSSAIFDSSSSYSSLSSAFSSSSNGNSKLNLTLTTGNNNFDENENDAMNLSKSFLNTLEKFKENLKNDLKLRKKKVNDLESNVSSYPCYSIKLLYDDVKSSINKTFTQMNLFFNLINELKSLEERYAAVINDFKQINNSVSNSKSNNNTMQYDSENINENDKIKTMKDYLKNDSNKVNFDEIYNLILNALKIKENQLKIFEKNINKFPSFSTRLLFSEVKNLLCKLLNDVCMLIQFKNEMNLLGQRYDAVVADISSKERSNNNNNLNNSNGNTDANNYETSPISGEIKLISAPSVKICPKTPYYKINALKLNGNSAASTSTPKLMNTVNVNNYFELISTRTSSSTKPLVSNIKLAAIAPKPINIVTHSNPCGNLISASSPTNGSNRIMAPIYSVPSSIKSTDKPQILLAFNSSNAQAPFANTVKNPVVTTSTPKTNLSQQIRSSPPKTITTTAGLTAASSPLALLTPSTLSSPSNKQQTQTILLQKLRKLTNDLFVDKNLDVNANIERKRKLNEILMTSTTNVGKKNLLNINNNENQIQQKEANSNEIENENKIIHENGKTSNEEKRMKLDNSKETTAINNNKNDSHNNGDINSNNENGSNMEIDSDLSKEDKKINEFSCSFCQLEFTDNEKYSKHVESHVKANEKMKNSNLKIKINSKCEQAPIEKRLSTSSNSEKDITKSSPETSRETCEKERHLKTIYNEQTNMQSNENDVNKSANKEEKRESPKNATLGTGKPGLVICQICNSKRFYSRVNRRFGIFACESCYRQFIKFQRNPLQYYCYKDGNCEVVSFDSNESKLCKGCWLKKCLELFTIDESMKLNLKKNFSPKILKKSQAELHHQQQKEKDQNENRNNIKINTGNINNHNENKTIDTVKITCVVCEALFHYKSLNEENYLSKLFSINCCDQCDEFFTNFISLKPSYICQKNGKCSLNQKDRCKSCWLQKGLKIFDITPTGTDSGNINETSKNSSVTATSSSSCSISSSTSTNGSSKINNSLNNHGSVKHDLDSNTKKIDSKLTITTSIKTAHDKKAKKSKTEKVSCVFCNQLFSSAKNLQYHMAMVHPSLIQNKDLPPKLRTLHKKSLDKFLKKLYPKK